MNNFDWGLEMIIKNPKFEVSAVNPKQYPKSDLPEFVLVRQI